MKKQDGEEEADRLVGATSRHLACGQPCGQRMSLRLVSCRCKGQASRSGLGKRGWLSAGLAPGTLSSI